MQVDMEDTGLRKKLQVRAFALTWFSYGSYYLTRKNFAVVKSRLNEDLGVSMTTLGHIDTVYLATYAVGQFLNGALGDRFGARRIIGIGMLASGALAWWFAMSNTAVLFAVAFGLNGLFQSTGWPNNVKAMGAWFGREARGKVMGFWCTCYQVGGLVASALATFLLVHFGWRSAFMAPGVWVSSFGVVILLFLVERPRDRGLAPADESPVLDGSVVSTAPKVGFLQVLRIPAVWALGGSYFGLKLIRYSLLFWLPYYLTKKLGYDEGVAGYMSTAFEAGGIIGAIVTGWLSDRYFTKRRMRLVVPNLMILAAALALYGLIGDLGIYVNLVSMAACGFLLFGPDALISGAAAQDVGGPGATGSAAGIINGMGSIGAILQGVLTTYVSQAYGWDTLFYVFVVVAIVSALILAPLAFRRATGGS